MNPLYGVLLNGIKSFWIEQIDVGSYKLVSNPQLHKIGLGIGLLLQGTVSICISIPTIEILVKAKLP